MKILTISTYDIFGGAARAAFRLHEALLQNNIDSQMLVADKRSDSNTITALSDKKKIWRRLCKDVFNKTLLNKYKKTMIKNCGPFAAAIVSNKKLVKTINEIAPDIVHLHWIGSDFLSIADIAEIRAPIVWSLHDNWAFTGGCHLVAGTNTLCDKYTQNCGTCGFLGSKKTKDLSFSVLKRKKKVFSQISKMTIIGVSKWMAGCAKKSAVFSDKNVACLPNPLNTNIFKPIDKAQSRMLWNLPKNKKLILFGAIEATSTPYKGYDLLIGALNKISSENVECVVFGSSEPKTRPEIPQKIRYVGHLNDAESLVTLYSACDLMVVSSLREAFGQTASESLSCGTPVVAFGHSGLLDIVDHQKNGYLAQPFDTSDLAKGIDWILNNDNYDELCKNAREKVVREFDYDVVAKKYINLYEKVL
jgi:glycosyltransferase involved in cell wall biosynthesis